MIHSISFITPRGHTISVKAKGHGPTVLFLHGFPLDHRMWLPQLDFFSKNFHCVVPELRGFGASTLDNDYSLAELAEDVELVRKFLAADQRVHLVGLSMGGYVALEYWQLFGSNLLSLTLANTKPTVDDPPARMQRLQMADSVFQQGTWPTLEPLLERLIAQHRRGSQVEQQMREMLRSARPAAVAAVQRAMAGRRDFSNRLDSICTPCLVITGQLDPIAPPDATQQWAKQIPGGRYCEIANSGHMTPIEAPDQFNDQLNDFLKSAQKAD